MRRRFHEHQKAAFRYTLDRRHPALFMEMRLGKTIVTIRRCLMYPPSNPSAGLRVLVIAPKTVLSAWQEELRLEGEEDVVVLDGDLETRLAGLQTGARWNLTNKEAWLVGAGAFGAALAAEPWDAVVLDESTFIKNPKARVTRWATTNFRDVPHRWILSGLPAPEEPLELFTQFAFLDNGRTFQCRNFWQFRAMHYRPHRWKHGEWVPKLGVEDWMASRVAGSAYVLRRRDVELDQPRVYERRTLELSTETRQAYRTAEEEFILEWKGKERGRTVWAMTRWQWLRQLCGGFMDGELVWPGKMSELENLIQGELRGQQVVIWFRYVKELLEAHRRLGPLVGAEIIFGATSTVDRSARIARFQRGECGTILIQSDVGQYGINLSAADTAIYYSTPVSNQTRRQSEDRILVAGERHPLLYLDLVVEGTVEEDIQALLRGKKARSDDLLEICKGFADA